MITGPMPLYPPAGSMAKPAATASADSAPTVICTHNGRAVQQGKALA
eukprot:SAG22_NODE_155_length_17123_cov_37.528489_28_plen_47_part_00